MTYITLYIYSFLRHMYPSWRWPTQVAETCSWCGHFSYIIQLCYDWYILCMSRIAFTFKAMHYKKNNVRGYLTKYTASHPRIPEGYAILTPFLQTQEVLSCVFESVPSKVHSCTNNLIHCFHSERTERARGTKGIKEREKGVIWASVPMEKNIRVLVSACRAYRKTDVPKLITHLQTTD